MVTILEDQPSFGQLFARGLGKNISAALQGGTEGYFQKKREKEEVEKFKKQFGFDLSKEGRAEFYKSFGKSAGEQPFKEALEKQKAAIEDQKKREEEEGLRNTLDWLDENVEYTGLGGVPGLFAGNTQNLFSQLPSSESYQKREEFTQAGFWAADKIYTHFNKGVISEEKLKLLVEKLSPKGDIFQAKNKARIAALRRISKLSSNISPEEFNKQLNKEIKSVEKIKSSEIKERPPLESFIE